MISILEPYTPRPIRFLELWQPAGWRIKVYGIAYRRDLPRPELVAAAKRCALDELERTAARHHGAGFLGVHDGRGANFVFIDFWADENELHHRVFLSPAAQPESLRRAGPDDPVACVWDVQVQAFERQAWVEAVLANEDGPDLEAYFECRLDAHV